LRAGLPASRMTPYNLVADVLPVFERVAGEA
jgi:hypothetical protein